MATTGHDGVRGGWIRVWDPLVRVFHWSLATAVGIALVSDGARSLHEAVGIVAIGLVLFRVVWGVLGPKHARFASFVRPPGAVFLYLADVARFRARRYVGHNPAGGAMIVLLLLAVLTAGISGWLSETDRFFGVSWVEDLHSYSADLLIVLIVFHVVGVLASSLQHRENLVRAMITGRKPALLASETDAHGINSK
jgi:cytochrome b